METVKRIPYGVADFERVIEENMYYVDKTMYLPLLEQQPDSLFFIRPRRFGKSLFLNMLRTYYDISKKNDFQKWFGNLWIGQHPTPNRGKYLILSLDFSQVGETSPPCPRTSTSIAADSWTGSWTLTPGIIPNGLKNVSMPPSPRPTSWTCSNSN